MRLSGSPSLPVHGSCVDDFSRDEVYHWKYLRRKEEKMFFPFVHASNASFITSRDVSLAQSFSSTIFVFVLDNHSSGSQKAFTCGDDFRAESHSHHLSKFFFLLAHPVRVPLVSSGLCPKNTSCYIWDRSPTHHFPHDFSRW